MLVLGDDAQSQRIASGHSKSNRNSKIGVYLLLNNFGLGALERKERFSLPKTEVEYKSKGSGTSVNNSDDCLGNGDEDFAGIDKEDGTEIIHPCRAPFTDHLVSRRLRTRNVK